MSEEELVPVFIPPLASLLAAAEMEAGRALSQEEVEGVRNGGVCVMMGTGVAQAMQASRGYRDVNPEDVWADWHRLRVQCTGNGYLPKIVWCLVGDEEFFQGASALLAAEPVEHEWTGPDTRMPGSFQASDFRPQPSLTDQDKQAIEAHTRVLYLPGPNVTAGEAIEVSARLLTLAARLLSLPGAAAMKCESSGIAHGKARWLELAESGSLVEAYVQFPIGDPSDLWSCGLHLLGRPDIILGRDVFDNDAWEAARHIAIFATYLVQEGEHFASGHTIRCTPDSPSLKATWEPCEGYDEDDFFCNPFGRLRLQRCK